VVSLDALAADPTIPLSKPAALRSAGNLELAKELLGSPAHTISTVIEQWNVSEVERLLDLCGEQDLFLRRSPRRWRKCRIGAAENPQYQALVDKIDRTRRNGTQPINGTPRRSRRCASVTFSAIRQCFPGVSERDVLSLRAAA